MLLTRVFNRLLITFLYSVDNLKIFSGQAYKAIYIKGLQVFGDKKCRIAPKFGGVDKLFFEDLRLENFVEMHKFFDKAGDI